MLLLLFLIALKNTSRQGKKLLCACSLSHTQKTATRSLSRKRYRFSINVYVLNSISHILVKGF